MVLVSKSGDVYPISEISFDQNKIVYSPGTNYTILGIYISEVVFCVVKLKKL
jgi:hypothetical protein